MSKFLKLKEKDGQRILIAVSTVTSVQELENGAIVNTADSAFEVKEGYQTLVNRLTKDDADE